MTWRDIPGWEKQYSVSDKGEVRSLPRTNRFSRSGKPSYRRIPGRVLKKQVSPNGYLKVSLTKSLRREQPFIHDLVLLAFKGPKPDHLQVRHLDGKKENNWAENLAYGTAKENAQDRAAHGTFVSNLPRLHK